MRSQNRSQNRSQTDLRSISLKRSQYERALNLEKKKSLAPQRHRPEFLARNEAFLVRFFSLQSIARATFLRATCRKENKTWDNYKEKVAKKS